LDEFGASGGEADLDALGFARPALAGGLGEPGREAVRDVLQTGPLSRIDAQ
jgi:hypothetical protein